MIFHPAVNDVAQRFSQVNKALREGTLTAADSRYIGAGYSYVYKEGSERQSPQLGFVNPDAALVNESTDDYIPFVVTDSGDDRDGDIVRPMGCMLENYKRNPLVFFGHQEWLVPIGVCRSPDGRITVFPEENRVVDHWYVDKPDPDAMFIYGKVKRKILNATSIAFVPIEAIRREYAEKSRTHGEHGGPPLGWFFKSWDKTEVSMVGVPSNPRATQLEKSYRQEIYERCRGELRDALDTEKKFISPKLQRALVPYCAKGTNEDGGCWTGWCPGPNCSKPIEGKRDVAQAGLPRKPSPTKQGSKSMSKSCGCSSCKADKPCCGKTKAPKTAAGNTGGEARLRQNLQSMSRSEVEHLYENAVGGSTVSYKQMIDEIVAEYKDDPNGFWAPHLTKALTEASGTNGGYTVTVGTTSTDGVPGVGTPVTATNPDGMVVCTDCGGSRNCVVCKGAGELEDVTCRVCGGSGECKTCAGVGSVAKVVKRSKRVTKAVDAKLAIAAVQACKGSHNFADMPAIRQWLVSNGMSSRKDQDESIIAAMRQGVVTGSGVEGRHGISADMQRDMLHHPALGDEGTGHLSMRSKSMKSYLVRCIKGYLKKAVDPDDDEAPDGDGVPGEDEFTEEASEAEEYPDEQAAQSKVDDLPPEDMPEVEEVDKAEEPEASAESDKPMVMKPSAVVATKAYQHHQHLKEFIDDNLNGNSAKGIEPMDHPGMAAHLEKHKAHLAKAMDHMADGVMQHHKGDYDGDDPHELMGKMCKSLEGPVGENNLVNAGEVPPQGAPMVVNADMSGDDEDAMVTKASGIKCECSDDGCPCQGHCNSPAEYVVDSGGGEFKMCPKCAYYSKREFDATILRPMKSVKSDDLLERYQDKAGKWATRVVGKMRRAKDGRVFLVRGKAAPAPVAKPTRKSIPGSRVVENGDGTYGVSGEKGGKSGSFPTREEADRVAKGEGGRSCPYCGRGMQGSICPSCGETKAMLPDDDMQAVKDAGDMMGEMAEDDAIPKSYQVPLKHHAKRLGSVHKALTNMGKLQRDGGTGSELTEMGAVEANGGGGSALSDKGSLEKQAAADPRVVQALTKLQQRMAWATGDGLRGNGN